MKACTEGDDDEANASVSRALHAFTRCFRSAPLAEAKAPACARPAFALGALVSLLARVLPLAVLCACEASSQPSRSSQPALRLAPPLASVIQVVAVSATPSAVVYPPPPPPDPPIVLHAGGRNAVRGIAGVVTTVEANATHVGAQVLRSGGNAVDAAVAVAFALAVTHPSAGNIGGGGFMLVRMAGGETQALDFREKAPSGATVAKNEAMLAAGGGGYASAAVPGTVAGMVFALSKYGSRPLAELVGPAIFLAKKGHRLGARQAQVLAWSWNKLRRDPAARAVFGPSGRPLAQGESLKQPDLARTLSAIAKDGRQGFYGGPVAAAVDAAMRAHGGLVTPADLAGYEARVRAPLRFSYRGFTVETMPPPSMGGIALAQILLTLERQRAYEAKVDSGLALHLFIEASRRAYSERRRVGADPDFMGPGTEPSVASLLSGEHLETRKPFLDRDHATLSSAIEAEMAAGDPESPETTHFSIVDAAGNAVSCTYTQSASFGSKVMVPGTGMLLANGMGAFSPTGVNALAPGKRMASSMSPTLVSRAGKVVLVLGSPGGDTIPNTVAQVLRNAVDYGMTIDEAVEHARVHHQYLPDVVRVERTNLPPQGALRELAERGHKVERSPSPMGDANSILVDAQTGEAFGVADAREGGKAEGVDFVSATH